MESNNFSALENRKLIDYLIGEKESRSVLPYLSGSKIQKLALTFGIFLSEDDKRMSRWMQFELLLKEVHKKGRSSDLLVNITSEEQLHDVIDSVIDISSTNWNDNILPSINWDTDQIKMRIMAWKSLVDEVILKLNEELADTHLIIEWVGHQRFDITNGDQMPKIVIEDTRITESKIKSLVEKGFQDISNGSYDATVTIARTMVEQTFLQILNDRNRPAKENGNIKQYQRQVNTVLNMINRDDLDPRVIKMVDQLGGIVNSIKEFRDNNSTAHASLKNIPIGKAEAKLVLDSAMTLSSYYLEVDSRTSK